jgi:hypothetical protein
MSNRRSPRNGRAGATVAGTSLSRTHVARFLESQPNQSNDSHPRLDACP